jgi:hypothetical protein
MTCDGNCQAASPPEFSKRRFLESLSVPLRDELYPLTLEGKWKEMFKELVEEEGFRLSVPSVLFLVDPFQTMKEPFFRDEFMKLCVSKFVNQEGMRGAKSQPIEPFLLDLIETCNTGNFVKQIKGTSFEEFLTSVKLDFRHNWHLVETHWSEYFRTNEKEFFFRLNDLAKPNDKKRILVEAVNNLELPESELQQFRNRFGDSFETWHAQQKTDWWLHRVMCRSAHKLLLLLHVLLANGCRQIVHCSFDSGLFLKLPLMFRGGFPLYSINNEEEWFFNFGVPDKDDLYQLHASASFYLEPLSRRLPVDLVFHILQFLPFFLINRQMPKSHVWWMYDPHSEMDDAWEEEEKEYLESRVKEEELRYKEEELHSKQLRSTPVKRHREEEEGKSLWFRDMVEEITHKSVKRMCAEQDD